MEACSENQLTSIPVKIVHKSSVFGNLIRCKETGRLLWIIAAPIVKPGGAGLAVAGGTFHVI